MSFDWFFGKVTKVAGEEKDHDYAGDAQIRIDSDQDDKSRLPDDKLRWARMVWPVTAAQNKGVGVSGGYLTPGTQIFGFFVDQDKQIPMILGTIATSGKYGSLSPEGELDGGINVTRSFPGGIGDEASKSLGEYAERFMLQVSSASDVVENQNPNDRKWKTKKKTPEKYGKEEGGNGPAKGADLPHLGSKKEPSSVPDIIKHVTSVNPKNLGGLPSTLGAFNNIKNKLEGTVKDLVGATPFAQMQVLSSVINMNPSNIMSSLSTIMKGVNGLSQSLGDPKKALNMLQNDFFSGIPMDPLQSLAVNMAVGGLKSGSNVESASVALTQLSEGQSLTTEQLIELAKTLSQMLNNGPTTEESIKQLLLISQLLTQIEELLKERDLSTSADNSTLDASSGQINQLQGLAQQAGSILGVGNQLSSLASNPMQLMSTIQSIMGGNIGKALGLGNTQSKDNLKRDEQRLPPSSAKPKYPYNKVQQTAGGHRRETDDTPGKERLFKSHKSGSYEEYAPDGKITSHSVGNRHEYTKGTRTITVDGFSDVIVKGSKIVIKGGSLVEIMGNCDLKVTGSLTAIVTEDFKVTAKNISLIAQDQLYTNTKNTKNVVGQKHQTNANVVEELAKSTIREVSDGLIYSEASGGTYNIKASGDVVTKGSTTKVQGGGAVAPPTTFT